MDAELTAHAVDRFRQRCRPDLSFEQARALLELVADSAAQLRERTRRGDLQLLSRDPAGGCVLICKPDRAARGGVVVLTVISLTEAGMDLPAVADA